MFIKKGGKKSRRHLGGRRHKKGGQSANEYMMKTVGDGNTQWDNVFKGNGAADNAIRGIEGQSASSSMNPASLMQGGKKRRTRKGGQWGEVMNRALVPLSLWAMQNKYSKKQGFKSLMPFSKKGGKSKSRKTRKHHK